MARHSRVLLDVRSVNQFCSTPGDVNRELSVVSRLLVREWFSKVLGLFDGDEWGWGSGVFFSRQSSKGLLQLPEFYRCENHSSSPC